MSSNPYHPPPSIATQSGVEQLGAKATRPVGISILAVLHVLGGLLLFGTQFLLFANLQAMEDTLRAIGIPPMLLIIGVLFLAVLTTASGVGMWIGAKWGWWLGSFYYVYSIFRNTSALLTVITMAAQMEEGARGPEYYLFKHGARIVIHFLLFLYFFKGNVLAFFGLAALSKPRAVATLVGICIAITTITSLISMLVN